MKVWITRHGQTVLNKKKLMQGLSDIELNETGISQAKEARKNVENVTFDAVYASPLDRAIVTASIIGDVPREKIFIEPRIIEVNFGKYEKKSYYGLGLFMTLYWAFPEVFPAPKSVEPIQSMVERSKSFLNELKGKDYENVLIVCHGGIIRALCGVLEGRKKGIKWRPKPKNCEMRVYELNKDSSL